MGYWKKPLCLEHEDRCFKNPNVKSCWNCGFFEDNNLDPWFCSKFKKNLTINPDREDEMRFKNKGCKEFKRRAHTKAGPL